MITLGTLKSTRIPLANVRRLARSLGIANADKLRRPQLAAATITVMAWLRSHPAGVLPREVDPAPESVARPSVSVEELRGRLQRRRLPGPGRTWLELAQEVADHEGVTLIAMLSRRRDLSICRARRRVWAELRVFGYSYPEIAKAWGRDHTTVFAALNKEAA